MSQPLIIIPARMASVRLPNKPLALIGEEPMIVHVWRRVDAAKAGPVYVACDDERIKQAVEAAGGQAVLTDPELPSGSDRVHAAAETLDPEGRHARIINVQGDLPTLESDLIAILDKTLADSDYDIATLITPVKDASERDTPSVVKPIVAFDEGGVTGRALYFTRAPAPHGEGPDYHHLGLYAFRREALRRFVTLPPSALELRERLEQLRALENGMTIGISVVDAQPLGVDTPDDLDKARRILCPM